MTIKKLSKSSLNFSSKPDRARETKKRVTKDVDFKTLRAVLKYIEQNPKESERIALTGASKNLIEVTATLNGFVLKVKIKLYDKLVKSGVIK
jgi:small-conductance mechanosensitive channel